MADIEFKSGTNVDSAYVDGHKVRLIAIPTGSLQLPISATSDSGYVVDGNGKKHRVLLATFLAQTPEYKDSATADSAYVTIDGKKHKVTLTATLSDSLELPDSANADQGYATGSDSKKHRVTLVATPTGSLELSDSETYDYGYIVDGNGKKHKVKLLANIAGGEQYIEVVVKGVAPLTLTDAIADSLIYLKAFGDCENRNLPEDYQELEYIEGNNNAQYINTGIVPTSSMSMYFKGQFISVDSSTPTQSAFLMGARDVSGQYGLFLQLSSTNVTLDWFTVNSRWSSENTRAVGDIVEMKVNNSLAEIFINGTSVGTHQYTPNDTTQYPLFLNGLNSVGQPFDTNVNVVNRVYRFIIEGICDMRPARRLSDGVLGMYDTIRKRFFANAGTGTFTAGNAVTAPTPARPLDIWCNNGAVKAIRPMEYLEATGTQYIDTGFKPNNNSRLVVDFYANLVDKPVIAQVQTDYNGMNVSLGVAETSGNAQTAMLVYNGLTANDINYARILKTDIFGEGTGRYTVDINKQTTTVTASNGSTFSKSFNLTEYSSNLTLWLFAKNHPNTPVYGKCKIYSAKIYDNGTLVRDFIPALDANNVPCLYEKVEGKCYYNAGTGQFIAPYLPADYEELEYIQGYCSDGSDSTIKAAYIDTGIILPANANFYLKSQLASSPTTNSYLMCGTRTAVYAGSEIYVGSANTVIDWYGSAESDRLTIGVGGSAGDIYEIQGNNKTLTVFKNGSSIGSKTFSSPTTPTLTFWLNSRNTNNQVTSQTAPTLGRIYRFTVAGVCDMIPARRISDGEIGMYDVIRRQFFTNAGTGVFTAGSEIPDSSESYYYVDGDVETIATKAGGSTLSTATCENLLGIDSTQDVQEILTGSITRKVAVWVFNGSETWVDFNNQHQMYQTPIPDTTAPTVATNIVCSHFVSDLGSLANMPNNSGKVGISGLFPSSAVLMIKKTDIGGLSQWMSFLRSQYDAGTPVIVVYPLAADETETVAGQTLTVSAGNNTAEIIQASIDGLELEVKYTKTVA